MGDKEKIIKLRAVLLKMHGFIGAYFIETGKFSGISAIEDIRKVLEETK